MRQRNEVLVSTLRLLRAEIQNREIELRKPLDDFFDQVTVNCDEPNRRINRLNLLSEIRDSLDRIADFSKIEG